MKYLSSFQARAPQINLILHQAYSMWDFNTQYTDPDQIHTITYYLIERRMSCNGKYQAKLRTYIPSVIISRKVNILHRTIAFKWPPKIFRSASYKLKGKFCFLISFSVQNLIELKEHSITEEKKKVNQCHPIEALATKNCFPYPIEDSITILVVSRHKVGYSVGA